MKKEETRFAESTLFEGMTSVRAVLQGYADGISDRRIKRILVDETKRKSREKELGWLSAKSREMGFPIEFVPAEVLEERTTGSTHGGVLAECTERTIPPLTGETELRPDGFYVMLEGMEDPYNFGNAIRSLYACGCDGIILSPRNWMTAAGVVCRASAGASELLPMYESEPVAAARLFRERGYRILCAGIRDSVSSFECDMRKPVYLIVGGEKRGISASLLAEADAVVRIDYGRAFRGSLSAASAAAMLGYEILRQNREEASHDGNPEA